MNRVAVAIASLLVCGVAHAQSIKGTVVDDATRAPVPGVFVTIIDANGADVGTGVRTDSVGAFVIHAEKSGSWRVKTMRIGYAPVTSPPVDLAVGALAVVRLRLTTVAQQLAPVQVVERRQYSAAELMSTMGFDLREKRGEGKFLDEERLAAMGRDGVREVLAFYFQPRLFVYSDPVLGDVLRMRSIDSRTGATMCAPEVYLDGRLLSTAPEPKPFVPDSVVQNGTVMDQMQLDADSIRRAFSQVIALNTLAGLTAQSLHGIEVYRANEMPPASLGAWFGMTTTWSRPCGAVAVWTKAGAISIAQVRSNKVSTKPLQVVVGTLVDFDTERPVAGREVTLMTEDRDVIGVPVVTDANGEFSIRTTRTGTFRLRAGDTTYRQSTSPPIAVASNELIVVRFYVSSHTPVLAPLGLAGRVLPQNIGATSRAGFTYRRERAQGGKFLRESEIRGKGAQSLTQAVSGIQNVVLAEGATAADSIRVRGSGARNPCRPVFYIDGVALGAPAQAAEVAMDRILGVEIYTRADEVPLIFSDTGGCGVIAIWTKK